MTSIFEINHCRVRARRSRQEIEWSWKKTKIILERLSRLSIDELPLNEREMLHVFAQRLTTYRGRLAMLLSLLTAEVPELGPTLGGIEGQRLYVAFAHLLEQDSELSEQDRHSMLLDGLAFPPVTRYLESLPRSAQTLICMHQCVPYLIQLHEQLETETLALKSQTDLEIAIDQAIFAVLNTSWQKTALVIGKAVARLNLQTPSVARLAEDSLAISAIQDDLTPIATRLETLARQGRLESQGDLARWRFSEVRLFEPIVLPTTLTEMPQDG